MLEDMVDFARDEGASFAKLVDVEDIVMDPRVRMKCLVPLCKNYRNNLMCPPNVPSVSKFRDWLERYEKAIILQIRSDINSLDKGEGRIDEEMWDDWEGEHEQYLRKLHDIVNALEAEAFKEGFHLAVGFIGSACNLCETCPAEEGEMGCRHPHLARPSLDAVGIDVRRTCENLDIDLQLSSEEHVRWTGIVFLE